MQKLRSNTMLHLYFRCRLIYLKLSANKFCSKANNNSKSPFLNQVGKQLHAMSYLHHELLSRKHIIFDKQSQLTVKYNKVPTRLNYLVALPSDLMFMAQANGLGDNKLTYSSHDGEKSCQSK